MAVADDLLANNRRFAAAQLQRHLDVRPALELAIVTCMDSRLDVFAALGLDLGQAHILRNAGGVVTDDVIRSLALSQRRLGTRAVMLIHHDDCGLQLITEDGFRSELEGAAGERPPFEIGAFSSVEESVRRSLERVRTSPFLLHRDDVRGFVHDVDTGALREVE
jgi:carbonic anhydrase